MLRLFLLLCSTIAALTARAQCLSGNCISGEGEYDFGWRLYKGTFKDGKPDGRGVMLYKDYRYTGTFKDGVEDGQGTLSYPDGRTEIVRYVTGHNVADPPKVTTNEYKPIEGHDPGCIAGDCNNGYGTYQFPSGNKYVGSFRDKKRQGQGTFYFTNGEEFAGYFKDNGFSSGTYTYASGMTYTGTYDAEGRERNGILRSGSRQIPISNGKPFIPKADYYGYDHMPATIPTSAKGGNDGRKHTITKWSVSEPSPLERDRDAYNEMIREKEKRKIMLDMPSYWH
jgi:hypothetical protein